ncbi:MAG: hypothetical protein K9N47_17870 [Prosthecobacter sp.]|uniref:hypothetical protein n=1 Tax=Prosthecobacter sp. TaxID=1965333 RepID=UPI0025E2CDDC|nr:hypothetical protein [Prosthecobacter sp.]MCF7787994.1 hypothetical protein [Prosthecobacter sp.]
MKPHLLFIALCMPLVASEAEFAAWTHRQTVQIAQPGLTRIELEPELLDASSATGGASFHDLRVVSPAGKAMPYIIALPHIIRPEMVDADGFKTTLNSSTTVLEFQPPLGSTTTEVLLQTHASGFIKSATLEASLDGTNWQTLASNELICRQNGTERLRFTPFAAAAWTRFRVTLDDARSKPVVFTGAQVRRDLPESRTVSQPVRIRGRTETAGETHLKIDLGSANLLLGNVRLHTPEAVFQREATLLGAHATLFRLQHEGRSAEDLDIGVHQIAATREVELVIRNGDSPPLQIESIEVTRHPVPVVFQADAVGEWQLFIGNAQAAEPRYDIAALGDKLRDASANSAMASAVEANADFRKTATAPEVGDVGPAIDVSPWSFQRPVQFKEAGVIVVELIPEVLARTSNDLHDMRVVRDGHQLPFIAIKPGVDREVEVPIVEVIDPKAPTWSKWDIQMPFANYPANELLLDSPTPLFARTLTVSEQHLTEKGHFERILSNANWQRLPGQAPNTFHLALYTAPRAAMIRLATDNGDNPRLQITSARVLYPVVRLLFRVPDTTPVQLCYGNRRAPYTRYDLQLVRKDFENATQVAGTLGDEEKLPGYEADPNRPSGLGGPWIWAALALVVGALLWVVAKMLPKKVE